MGAFYLFVQIRGLFVEWIIVILITFKILLTLLQILGVLP